MNVCVIEVCNPATQAAATAPKEVGKQTKNVRPRLFVNPENLVSGF